MLFKHRSKTGERGQFDSFRTGGTLSLPEVAVIVCLVGLLTVIVMPALADIAQQSKAAGCATNLHLIGRAIKMYAADNNDLAPNANPGSRLPGDPSPPPTGGPVSDCQFMAQRTGWSGWVGNLLLPYLVTPTVYQCPVYPQLNGVNGGGWNAAAGMPYCWDPQWNVPYKYTSYGYNYVSLNGRRFREIARPHELIAFYDAISPWADCGYMSGCGIWGQRDIGAWLKKMGLPLHPNMSLQWAEGMAPFTGPHGDMVNFLFLDGHVQARRWDQMKWGNLNGFILEGHPDAEVPLTTRPAQAWPGM